MVLSKQNIDVLFTQGIDTKKDSKITRQSSLLELNNGVFRKTGRITKRNGFDTVDLQDTAGATITNTAALMTYNDSELLLAANDLLYSYSPSSDAWVNKSNFTSNTTSIEQIISNSAEQTNMDSCWFNNLAVYAWEDTRGGVRYSVQDTASGVYYVTDTELDASGEHPRCVVVGGHLFILYGESTNLKYGYVSTATPTTITTGTLKTDLHTDRLLDAISINSVGYLYYKTSTANVGRIVEFDKTGTQINQQPTSDTIIDTLTIGGYLKAGVPRIYTAFKETASLVKSGVYSQNLVQLVAPTSIDTTASGDIKKITMHRTSTSANEMTFLYHLTGTSNADDYVMTNTLTEAGSAGTASVFIRSVGLASKIFEYNNNLHVAVLHESSLQATIFILNENSEIVAKINAGNSGTHAGVGPLLPSNMNVSSQKWCILVNNKGTIRSENATLFSRLGISKLCIDFEANNTYSYEEINSELFIAGGILKTYDSNTTVEQGFHLFPEGAAVTATPASGGNMSDGTYQYVFLYQWVDSNGNIHRSAPSVALSQTLSGGGSAQEIDFTIPTLRLTEKTGTRSEVTLEVFRTEDSGSIFYRVSSITAPTENDTTADTVAFTDDLADSSITGNEILYTTGGILDNIAAPSCDIVTTHRNRVFITGLDNKNEIRYSKIVRDGEGVAFNEALSIKVDPSGGAITQLASMDSNLIITKREKLYRVAGDGPSDTGQGATFTEPELIASDVGCIDPRSLVLSPEGLLFKSAKGIYLLSRSLTPTYIGAPVEQYNSHTITSAQLLYDTNEIRFMTQEGDTLVYNYYFKQWSVFPGQASLDSVIWNNVHTYLDSTSVYKQNMATHLDNSASVGMKIGTGWISTAGIQGFQRAYRMMLLGEFQSRHILKITTYVDYSDNPVQTTTLVPADISGLDTEFYGDDVYGDIAEYGSENNSLYQFQVHLKRQKCQAIRFVIEDVIDNRVDFEQGESMHLTGLTLQIGTKRGQNKVSSGNQS